VRIQNIACSNGSACDNIGGGRTTDGTQITACQYSVCTNTGTDTIVASNSATDHCVSGGPDTTTICQLERTFVFPNH
jgi:hypothetical protein